MTGLGLWIDDPIKRVLKRKYFDELAEMRIDTCALMLDTSAKGWDPKWRVSTIRELDDLVAEYNMELVLTVWPDPVDRYLKDMEEGLNEFLGAVPNVQGIEFDAEFNWKSHRVEGFRPQRKDGRRQSALDVAGDELVALTKRLKAQHNVRSELTTFTSHTENGRAADVAPHMDRLMPQAYSVRNRTRKKQAWKVPWTHSYGPGKMQRLTLDRTLLADGDQAEIGCGLAAYNQKWPDREAEEAMQIAYDTAMGYSPAEIRYWSSKWVLGVRENGYAKRFLMDLAQRCG